MLGDGEDRFLCRDGWGSERSEQGVGKTHPKAHVEIKRVNTKRTKANRKKKNEVEGLYVRVLCVVCGGWAVRLPPDMTRRSN